jgi:plastocyanin
MTNIKLISIFILTISLFFLGCVEEKPVATPVQTAIPTATATDIQTVVPTTVTPTLVPPTPVPTQIREQKLYTSDVDEYGFRKVTVRNGSAPYKNNTLTINSGDTVKWVSVTNNFYYLTMVSKEDLWNSSSSMMRYRLRFFNYTFDKPGEYEVYIKEFPRETHQKIFVNP